MKRFAFFIALALPFCGMCQFAPPAGESGSTAIHCDSEAFVSWATNCVVERGLQRIDNADYGYASWGHDADAIGKADNNVVSLGDAGVATLTFDSPICNGAGYDFAVFENGFESDKTPGYYFLELGFVEVSSDGENFFRFPAYSLTPTDVQVGGFDVILPSQIHNMAGKYSAFYGTPFDLDDIPDTVLLNKNAVTHVRIIDVVGLIDSAYCTYDSQGNIVNDPWPTPFNSSGFDLDAVGVIYDVAHWGLAESVVNENVTAFPNPTSGMLDIKAEIGASCGIFDMSGRNLENYIIDKDIFTIDISTYENGVYFLRVCGKDSVSVKKIIKK